jgi:hypothetical protein
MQRVEISWPSAEVVPEPSDASFKLQVGFAQPAPSFWWEAFSGALEILSRETNGAVWSSIRGVGEPPRGLEVFGVREDSVQSLRSFLDSAVRMANDEAIQAEEAREARKRKLQERDDDAQGAASRLTEAFRSSN